MDRDPSRLPKISRCLARSSEGYQSPILCRRPCSTKSLKSHSERKCGVQVLGSSANKTSMTDWAFLSIMRGAARSRLMWETYPSISVPVAF